MEKQELQTRLSTELHNLAKHEHLARLHFILKVMNIHQGHAWRDIESRSYCYKITIPFKQKPVRENWHYALAYLIHEFSHLVSYIRYGNFDHGSTFKRIEKRLLGLYGLSIDRKKVYLKALYASGKKVY